MLQTFQTLNRQTRLWIVFGLFACVLPVVATLSVQLYAAVKIASLVSDLQTDASDWLKSRPPVDNQVVAASVSSSGDRLAYETVRNDQQVVRQRSILVSLVRPFSTLSGVLMNPEQQLAFAQTKAADVARAECDLVQRILASQCIVTRARATEVDGKDVRFEFELAFVAKEGFGQLEPKRSYQFVQITADVPPSPVLRRYSLNAAESERVRAYKTVNDTCRQLRRTNGSCGIVSITMSSVRAPGGMALAFSSSATYGTLQVLNETAAK